MSLSSGTRLGVYEILALIGSGGMGDVYRARDTKLDREVAVKVLPDALAHDPDRLGRFEREAKVLAAFNHPHIAHIHGFDDSTGTPALVMELVDGPTLGERLSHGALPVDDALRIAAQIAEALEAAHEQGIIHRDLKPANVKVKDDGTVKVLDFGLAKAIDGAGAAPQTGWGATQSPTITTPAMMTGMGVILGTAAYMSPDQAKGRPADKRSDVWAFGCVLFEMLAGRRAFQGDDVAETLAAVLRGEPDWSALPHNLPTPVVALLRRSLEKDRSRRIADISTVAFLLDEAGSTPTMPAAAAEGGLTHGVRALVASSIAVAIAASGVAIWALRRAEPAGTYALTRFRVPSPEGATLFVGTNPQRAIALSPDGSRLVFSARLGSRPAQLFVRPLDNLDATPLIGTDGGVQPVVSPDGRSLLYTQSGGGGLYRVPITGGTPTLVCRTNGARGATWLPDNTIVFSEANVGLKRVPATGGEPQTLTSIDTKTESAHVWPQALPGGRAIMFNVQRANAPGNAMAIVLLWLDTGERRVLIDSGSMPQYLDSGYLVFRRAGVLMAAPFDLKTFEVRGTALPALDGAIAGVSQDGAQLAVAPSGAIAYVPGGPLVGARSLIWVDRTGAHTPTDAPRQSYENPRLSPDGSKVLVSITGDGSGALRDVWMYDFTRGVLSRLTTQKEEAESATWTPDGRTIVYIVQHNGQRDVISRPADGSGGETILASTNRHLHSGSWTPDGTTLLGVVASGDDAGTVWTVRKGAPALFLRGAGRLQAPMISPDGRWLAYTSNETNKFEVYVQAFPGPGAKYQVSSSGGTEPRWARSGREIFYRNGDDVLAVTVEERGTALDIGSPKKLFDGYFATVGGTNLDTYYDITPDGRRFLMIKADESSRTAGIVVVRDWTTELRARVPAR